MKVYDTEKIRNLVFIGHGGSGKTSLVSGIFIQYRGNQPPDESR